MHSVTKHSAVNPALIIDDVVDAYLQYNAAKKNLEADNKRKLTNKITHKMPTKQAGLESIIEPYAAKVLENPSMLLPSPLS